MLIVRGVNIYPQQIERVLMSLPQIGSNYLIQLEGLDEMTIKVELAKAGFDGQVEHLVKLQSVIAERLRTGASREAQGRARAAGHVAGE